MIKNAKITMSVDDKKCQIYYKRIVEKCQNYYNILIKGKGINQCKNLNSFLIKIFTTKDFSRVTIHYNKIVGNLQVEKDKKSRSVYRQNSRKMPKLL